MSDTAPLVIKVEHATAGTAADALSRLSRESHATEAATEALRAATQQLAAEMARASRIAEENAAAQRSVEEEMRRQAEAARKAAATRAAAAKEEADRKGLASLVTGMQAKTAAVAAEKAKEEATNRAALRAEFEELKRSLLSEEAAIKASYARRREMVRANVANQIEQQRLLRALAAAESKELATASPGLGRQLAGAAAVAAPVAGAAVATAGLIKVGAVTREFEVLNAGLITSTGSAEGAARAFEALQDKAADTPYKLQEVTSGFTRLVNYGLQPSERALTSYGNTSSALGKQLNDMIEAVADATQGEYERLKEFGIKASSQGDKVIFSFRGVKTAVDRDSRSIQDYLIRLGENNFGDAMANRMATLDGKISNLGDAWDALFRQIGQAGIGDLLKDAADTGIEALTAITAYLKSSEFNSAINALQGGFEEIAHVAHKAAGFATWLATGDTSVSKNADATIQAERERLALQQLEAEQAAKEAAEYRALAKELKTAERNFADLQAQQKKGLVDGETLKAAEASLVNMRATTKEAIDTQIAADAAAKAVAKLQDKSAQAVEALVAKGANRKSAEAEVKRQLKEAEANAKMLEAQYQRILSTPQGDRLGGFEKAGKDKGKTKAQEDQEKKDAAEFAQLQNKLRSEEEAIEASYKRRQQLIDARANKNTGEDVKLTMASDALYAEELANTKAARAKADREKEIEDLRKSLRTQEEVQRDAMLSRKKLVMDNAPEGPARDELLSKIQDQYAAEVLARNEAEDQKLQAIRDGFATEMELFQKQQDEKRQAILDAERLTAEERNTLLEQLQAQTDRRMAEEDAARNTAILKSSADLFGGLAKTAKNLGKENSAAYRGLYAAQRAFSIAEATLAISTGMAKALELGWPAGIPAGLAVAAQGAALMAQITGSSYSGAYDNGGRIPAGSFGVAGEKGPEIVWGPATVTSRRDTEQIFSQQKREMQSPQSMKIVVAPDPNTAAKHLATTEGERAVMVVAGRHATEFRAMVGAKR